MVERAGHLLGKEGEVLAAHAGRKLHLHVAPAEELLGHVQHQIGLALVVHQHAVAVEHLHLRGRAEGHGHALGDLPDAPVREGAQLGIHRAQRAAHAHVVADHVVGLAALDGAEGQHQAVQRGDVPGDQRLQRRDDLRRADDGVHAVLRVGRMAALAPHVQLQLVAGGVERAVAGLHRAQRQVRLHMQAVARVHVGILQHARLHHRQRAAGGLLRGLEQQLHAAVQPVAHFRKHLRHAQLDRRVHIVAAGVHPALVGGSEGTAHRLGQRQRVDVRAQADAAARLRALDQANHPGLFDGVGNLQFFQGLADQLLRLEFAEALLRDAMQRAALFHRPRIVRLHQLLQFLTIHFSVLTAPRARARAFHFHRRCGARAARCAPMPRCD